MPTERKRCPAVCAQLVKLGDGKLEAIAVVRRKHCEMSSW